MNDLKLIPAIGETPELAQKNEILQNGCSNIRKYRGGEMNFSTFTDYVK